MVDLRIRRLDDWVANAIRARAQRNGHSLEEELRNALRSDVMRERQGFAERAQVRLEKLRAKYGTFSDSTALIRQERDEAGV
jgi:plasmid stability protein